MSHPDFDIKYVADLARIQLSEEEERQLGVQLGEILGYVDKLKELDVGNVEPTAHAFPINNVMRPDEAKPGLSHDEVAMNAPAISNGLIMVPKIVE